MLHCNRTHNNGNFINRPKTKLFASYTNQRLIEVLPIHIYFLISHKNKVYMIKSIRNNILNLLNIKPDKGLEIVGIEPTIYKIYFYLNIFQPLVSPIYLNRPLKFVFGYFKTGLRYPP